MQHAPILEGQDPFPVVVFSHGIGGTRNAYSGICSELGSAVSLSQSHPFPVCTEVVLKLIVFVATLGASCFILGWVLTPCRCPGC